MQKTTGLPTGTKSGFRYRVIWATDYGQDLRKYWRSTTVRW